MAWGLPAGWWIAILSSPSTPLARSLLKLLWATPPSPFNTDPWLLLLLVPGPQVLPLLTWSASPSYPSPWRLYLGLVLSLLPVGTYEDPYTKPDQAPVQLPGAWEVRRRRGALLTVCNC